ncbi:MAG TPA: hypothetical protein VHX11_08640 [Acidobacteriaceae bacterium]|nr:hypothetical protein [Acidobacteriaceae bacterium]
MSPFLGIAIVLLALSLLTVSVKRLQSRHIGPELSRKLVHMGMGIVCLSFPWLFRTAWPVWLLAAVAGVSLLALRSVPLLRRELGGVLHDVGRTSFGELYFPFGVAVVFTLARGHTILFVIPVALLTFADAAGALVGKRWGRVKYITLEGQKSIEGSAAVGIVACLCVLIPLLATGHTIATSLLAGLIIGLFGLMLEAISWRGTDNVFLPLAAFAQISVYIHAPLGELFVKLAVLSALTILAMVWRRRHIIDDGARLGATLAMYFFWAIGGWRWLVAPVVLLACYVRLMPIRPHDMPRHDLVAVICVSSVGIVWCIAEAFLPDPRWLSLFTLGLATHQAIIATVRYSQARPQWPRAAWTFAGVAQAVSTQGIAFWLVNHRVTSAVSGLPCGAACLIVATIAFVLIEPKLQDPDDLNARWWKQGATAIIASITGLYLMGV